jgi:hypothetical protein
VPTETEAIAGDVTKHLYIDEFEMAASEGGISDDVSRTISRTVRDAEMEGGFYIGETEITPVPNEGAGTVLMQIEPVPAGGQARLLLRLNEIVFKGRTLTELDSRVAHSKDIVANSLKEAVWHEIGHAKLIAGKSMSEIETLYAELKPLGMPNISLIAAEDGAEAIAEIEVLLRRGGDVPEDALKFYEMYMKRN